MKLYKVEIRTGKPHSVLVRENRITDVRAWVFRHYGVRSLKGIRIKEYYER